MKSSNSFPVHAILPLWRFAVIAVLLGGLNCQPGFAQEPARENGENRAITRFLKRLDRNGDEILDQNEMAGQAATYLQTQGFDTSKPIPLNKVLEKYDPSAQAKPDKPSSSVVRKVPGFGIETDPAQVPGFSGAGQMSPADMEAKYGRRVMELVERTLQGYDKNKNSALDPDEVAAARWGSPPATESDTNKDGTISKIELAERYLARDLDANRSQSSRGQPGSPRSNVVARSTAQTENPGRTSRTVTRSRPITSSSSRPRTPPPRSAPRVTTSSANTGYTAGGDQDRYARYANGLMSQYDANKDGKLDQGELAKMRRPPNNADVNGDGFITSAELTSVLSGSAASGQSETPVEAMPESRRPVRDENPGQPSQMRDPSASRTPRSSRDRGSFSGLDTNGDGQVQMHEFSQDWDGEVLAQFQAKDTNGDGVITSSEWNGR